MKKMIDTEQLKQQAITLKLHGLLAHWPEVDSKNNIRGWQTLLSWEYRWNGNNVHWSVV